MGPCGHFNLIFYFDVAGKCKPKGLESSVEVQTDPRAESRVPLVVLKLVVLFSCKSD